MPEHSVITDPNIHEPKGITTASEHEVYVANGANSGSWQLLAPDSLLMPALLDDIEAAIDNGTVQTKKTFYLSAVIQDISAPTDIYIPVPEDCEFMAARLILGGAISGANSTITFFDAGSNSMGTGVTVLQSGSAAGDAYLFAPSANSEVIAGDFIRINTDGASSTTAPLYITLKFEVPIV